MSFQTFLDAYIECAFFTSNDESDERGGKPLDDNYSARDLAPEALARMTADCRRFYDAHSEKIDDDAKAGRDFWCTRNGHGCGFWDGDWPEPLATELTDAAHAFGECWMLVGEPDADGDALICCD